jgi:hypothetical protein
MSVTEVNPNGAETEEAPHLGSASRARLVSVTVQLQVVADDGSTLHPLQVAPISVSAGDWPTFDVDAQMADVQRQLDQREQLQP